METVKDIAKFNFTRRFGVCRMRFTRFHALIRRIENIISDELFTSRLQSNKLNSTALTFLDPERKININKWRILSNSYTVMPHVHWYQTLGLLSSYAHFVSDENNILCFYFVSFSRRKTHAWVFLWCIVQCRTIASFYYETATFEK